MKWLTILNGRLRGLLRREAVIEDIDEEMRSHVEMDTEAHIGRGLKPEDARQAAMKGFGNLGQMRELAYDVRGGGVLESLWQDLRFGVRMLQKSPGFTAVAVLTLALGIGANSAIFSVVNAMLLQPLPYREPGRIVTILYGGRRPVAPADFFDWRAQSQTFEAMAAAELWGGTLTDGDRPPEKVAGIRFSEGMFQILGVQPLVGRTFQADDFKIGSDHRILVLTHSLWQRRFGGSRNVIGQSLTLSGESYTVIGVMPPGFQFAPFWATASELAAPLDLTARATLRGGNSLRVFARLKPDRSLAQVQTEMDAICKRLELAYPASNTGRTVRVDLLLDKVVGDVRRGLLVLAGAVLFVLMIACTNVANLLLVRAGARQKEMAIRTALGASRWRTIRQLLTESVVLAFVAGMLGLLLGRLGIEGIKGLLLRMPRGAEVTVDSTTLFFTLGVAVATSFVFGVAPALQSARPHLQGALKESGRGTTEGRGGRRLRNVLVVVEIALALVTLVGAGLMLRSFARLVAVDSGFNSRNVLSMVVSLDGQPDMVGGKRKAFYDQLFERIRELPGVASASAINHLPLAGDLWNRNLKIEGRPPAQPGEGISPVYRVCRPDYFQTMGIALLRGRDFNEQDTGNNSLVVIINERLARRHWPGENPVGKRITLDDSKTNASSWRTIVGVVKDAKQRSWIEEADDEIYVPFLQSPYFFDTDHTQMTLVVRTTVEPSTVTKSVQTAVWDLNRNAPVSNVATLEQIISDALSQQRFNLILIGLFATLALVLGAVGIYGVMAYVVSQRTSEIGIRMALGAERIQVLWLVLRQGMVVGLIGILIGLAGAIAAARYLAGMLFGLTPLDPTTYAAVAIIFATVTLIASYIPARRAARVDPLVALRYE